jgi:hypothetical protein
MSNLTIVQPQEPIADKNGVITRSWWRFFQQVFSLLNTATPTPPEPDYATLVYADLGTTGPDYNRATSDLELVLSDTPNTAGRVAALEARVTQLETMIAAFMTPAPDLIALQNEADYTQAMVMGVH